MPRTYVVTGAGSGIGKALSERLTSRGERVIGIDLRGAEITCDLSDRSARDRLAHEVAELSDGVIDGVAAVAGIPYPVPPTVAVNYFGAVDVLVALQPLLAKSAAPRAAIVSSFAAIGPTDEALVAAMEAGDEDAALERAQVAIDEYADGSAPIYGSTKYAVSRWIRRNATLPAWAGAGIALNAIAPGVVDTPLMAKALGTAGDREALAEILPAPLNGPAPATTPAALLDWLLGAENTHVTGQVIFIDGGTESLTRSPQF